MGRSVSGDITIVFKSERDARYALDTLNKIEAIVKERLKQNADFNIYDLSVNNELFYCKVSSGRAVNGEFQINQIIEQLKIMVNNKEIEAPDSFEAELLTNYESWDLEEEEFKTI